MIVTTTLLLALFAQDARAGSSADSAATAPVETGVVEGSVRVELADPSIALSHLGPMVAYLEPVERSVAVKLPAENPRIQQKNARFHPDFLVVCQGQTVDMPNDDKIYHNVFSYSKPNAFDLGLYSQGSSRSVRFDHPGVVKIYCSIHESMNGVIFVAPTQHFARVKRNGSFRIKAIPPGDYTLTVWCERLPEKKLSLTVKAGETTTSEVPLAIPASRPKSSSSPKTTPGLRGSSSPTGSAEPTPATGPPTPTPGPVKEIETDCCDPKAPV